MASTAQRRIKSVSYAKYGYLFILPFFLIYCIFMLTPLVNTFLLSFKGNGDRANISVEDHVGTANYDAILFGKDSTGERGMERAAAGQKDAFAVAIKNTVILWIGNFIPQIILSLALAVWFTDARLKIPGKGFFKVVMYMPNIITAASVAVLFMGLTTKVGPINTLIKHAFNTKDLEFFASVSLSRATVMFIQTWMWFGNTMIMLMSGIMGISPSLFEAAEIDGANGRQTFWRITMPLLSPILVYTVITSMIGGLQMYDIPKLYTNSSSNEPLRHIRTVAVYIFERYASGRSTNVRSPGYAAAASVILFVITALLGTFIFYMNRDKDEVARKKQRKKAIKQAKAKSQQFGGLSI